MSSILTNNSAMVALQTLKSINSNLADTQAMISTGKAVGSAKDNSAVWAIAQFNGLNLLDNKETGADLAAIVANTGSGEVNVLSSLDRSANGNVTSSTITAGKADLGTGASTLGAGTDLAATALTSTAALAAPGSTGTITVAGDTATAAREGNAVLAGDGYELTGADFGLSEDVSYVARDGDTVTDIAKALEAGLKYQAALDGVEDVTFERSGAVITFTNNTGGAIAAPATTGLSTEGTVGGGLELLSQLDVSTLDGAKASLAAFESLVQTSIDAAAAFGSTEGRIEIQSDFVSSLSDSLKSGIGALVDANMEEASYAPSSFHLKTDRKVEAEAIGKITARLRSADSNKDRNFPALVTALHDNRRLWNTLAVDVIGADNELPEQLRAQIFYLAEFTELYSAKVLKGEADAAALIEVNTSVMRGLNAEMSK